jgi:uncharacterized protein (TIGR02145 family)
MKARHLFYAALAAMALAVVSFTACDKDNSNGTTQEHPLLGKVSFATDSTWRGGSQEWSDAVQTVRCSGKTDYMGYDSIANEYCADCRSTPDGKGDLFSWEMVRTCKAYLCPDGWRVPTRDDFRALDIALGGIGEHRKDLPTINEKYLNPAVWGGQRNGYCMTDGTLPKDTLGMSTYWSQAEANSEIGFSLLLLSSMSMIYPQGSASKYTGLSLRCVRDVQ